MPIRDRRDRQWATPQRLCAGEAASQALRFSKYRFKNLTIPTQLLYRSALHHKAQVCNLAFNQREASIASREQKQFHPLAQFACLRWSEPPMHLESNQIGLLARAARPSAQIVLAVCEQSSLC